MKRLHVHISVDDLSASKRFYSALFGQGPSVEKPDYAKWAIDDPRVNLSVSEKPDRAPGLNHLGIQAESDGELDELHDRLAEASVAMRDQPGAQCCYARSDKHWATDPQGIVWELFRTMGEVATYGENRAMTAPTQERAAHEGAREGAQAQGCCC